MNLLHIAQGWFNFLNGSMETRQMMSERLAICSGCPHQQVLSTTGQVLLTAVKEDAPIVYCGACHCPLAGKSASPAASCPMNKWKAWTKPETYY